MQEIWLARHGETAWSLSGQHTGRTDIPLTARGQQQATALGARLAGQSFVRVLSSPLQRAQDTARLAGLPEAESCPDLMEWDYGDFEGRTTADIRTYLLGEAPFAEAAWTIWDGPVPQGETLEQVAARARSVIELCPPGRSLVFGHGHLMRVLAACWLGLPPQDGRLLALSTASLSILGYEHETRVLLSWNQHG